MSPKVVLFGAGATGRGHVGLLAWEAGYELVLVDRKRDLVDRLRDAGTYAVRLYGQNGCKDVTVNGYRTYHADERHAIASEIAGAALVLTAVFDRNLPDVAETLALGAAACRSVGRAEPLNVLACENMMDSSSTLGRHVRQRLNGAVLAYHDTHFGYPDCVISRVVPVSEPDPLFIVTEDYNEWTARADAFIGAPPAALTTLEAVHNQDARLERKLFIHNGGHAICGYAGYQRGHRYIHEAVADPWVGDRVLGALDEIGAVVQHKHGFSAASIEAYKADLVRRGGIPEMRDEIARVVRDPIRKLSPRERLVAPALLAAEYGFPRKWIVRGIVSVLMYDNPGDPQSAALQQRLATEGLPAVLQDLCGLGLDHTLAAEICSEYEEARR